jgi:formate/nitrite transporter FocA (FNT family)
VGGTGEEECDGKPRGAMVRTLRDVLFSVGLGLLVLVVAGLFTGHAVLDLIVLAIVGHALIIGGRP